MLINGKPPDPADATLTREEAVAKYPVLRSDTVWGIWRRYHDTPPEIRAAEDGRDAAHEEAVWDGFKRRLFGIKPEDFN